MADRHTSQPSPPAPEARRRAAQLREAAAPLARRSPSRAAPRRSTTSPAAPGSAGDAVPPLPDPPGPARGRLRRGGRGDGALGRRPRRPAAVGRARAAGCTGSSATPRRSARSPQEMLELRRPRRRRLPACRGAVTTAGDALLERAQDAGAARPDASFNDVGRLLGGIADIHGAEPSEIERLLDIVARRPALPARRRQWPGSQVVVRVIGAARSARDVRELRRGALEQLDIDQPACRTGGVMFLRARRDDDDRVHLGAQRDRVAGLRRGRLDADVAVRRGSGSPRRC